MRGPPPCPSQAEAVGIVLEMTSAVGELEKVRAARGRAAARVAELDLGWRQAVEQSREASAQLAEVERSGASAARRHAAEEKLGEAKQRAGEPWAERVEGAKAALRDADARVRAFVEANLGELIDGIEERGEAAASRVNSAAAELLSAVAEWRAVESELSATIVPVHQPGVGDVSRPQPETEAAARAVAALVAAGGERGPALERRNAPWDALLAGVEPEPAVVA